MGGWTRLAEADSGWDLDQSPGFLRLQVRLDAWQVLVRDAPQGSFEISTRVLFLPYSNFQTAGMVVYKDEGYNLSFHRGTCESLFEVPDLSQSNAVCFIHTDRELAEEDRGYAVGPQFPTRTDVMGEAYLRLTREGSVYTGYFSEDGENWMLIDTHDAGLQPMHVGILTCCAGDLWTYADCDFFRLGALP